MWKPAVTASLIAIIALQAISPSQADERKTPAKEKSMELGAFSISLAVKDLDASYDFYTKLGFTVIGGSKAQNYYVLRNGDAAIGIFQGMFEKNILTFNPGWTVDGNHPDKFTDIRDLQRALKKQGMKFDLEADPTTKGPASFVITDPDGNPILFDQHR